MTRASAIESACGRTGCLCISSRPIFTTVVALVTALLLTGCGRDPDVGDPDVGDTPPVLRVAVIPDRPSDESEQVFRPLLDFISAQTGFTFELVLPPTYERTLELLGSGDLDLVRFGGFSYVLAQQRYGAEPLVTRDVDLMFRSVIIVHEDLAVDDLQTLRGRSLQFGPNFSTSGHVMPRIFLEGAGIVPEDFFSEVTYGVNHIDTIRAVAAGDVDAGAVNSVILERVLSDNKDIAGALRVAWTSPRYANYVWATRAGLDVPTAHSIRGGFLTLSRLNPEDKVILDRVGAAGYLPAQQKNYDMLTAYVETLESAPQ